MNKENYQQGDSMNIEARLNRYSSKCKTASLHLCIEELKTGRKWHYRYPLINGYINFNLFPDSSLTDGLYAFNFFVQKWFFNLNGVILNPTKKDSRLNYVLLPKNKELVNGSVQLNDDSTFKSEYFLFQDSAYLFFSRAERNNFPVKLNINNWLDSSFIAVDSVTKIIAVGPQPTDQETLKNAAKSYQFHGGDSLYKTMMAEVVVNAKSRKLLDDFQKENVSGMFAGIDGMIIDGLESDDIARSTDLYSFLVSRVGGLMETVDDEGNKILTWRKHRTDIYVDEVKTDQGLLTDISPLDIAMIKVVEPGMPISFGSAQGGTIAIYLKNGMYRKQEKTSNSFYVKGYTGLDTIWK